MYILHRQLNGKFLPLADFRCEPYHSQLKIEGRVTRFSGRKMIHRINIPCIPRRFDNDVLPYNLNWLIYNIFPLRFNRLQWCNGYLVSLPHWRPRLDSRGRKTFFVFNLIFPIFYIFCNKSLVAFYIKFNALAKSSHFFFIIIIIIIINFQIQTALSQLW